MNTATLPKFKGKPLINSQERILEADFLGGDFGKAVLEEYQGRVKADYEDNHFLDIFSCNRQGNVVEGSNPFAVVLVNQILRASGQSGLRTATPADLERILARDALALRGYYEDSALALRTVDEPNRYLAQKLITPALVKANRECCPDMIPYVMPCAGLDLRVDKDSEYDLTFALRDDAELIIAPILVRKRHEFDYGYFKSADIDEKTGIPKYYNNVEGDRILSTRRDGLSRLVLTKDLNIDSDDYRLSDSNPFGRGIGRIVVVRDVAA